MKLRTVEGKMLRNKLINRHSWIIWGVLTLVLFLFPIGELQANELNLLFKQANNFVKQGNYQDAVKIYHELEKQSNDSNLYYNIGHCYNEINEPGYAVYYYKRALYIDSSNNLAREALEKVESTIISSNVAESSFINRIIFKFYNALSINRLGIIVLILFITLGTLIYLFLSRKLNISIVAKRFYITFNIFLLLLFISISISKIANYYNNQEIVVVKKNTIIHKDDDGRIFSTNKKLQAGLTLKYLYSINERRAGFSIVALPNGERIALEDVSFKRIRK